MILIRFYILSNNNVLREKLLAEHGLSILIETNEKRILFDVGQTDVFYRNAINMGLDLSEIDFIVLSHGHYDHTGGLKYLSFKNKSLNLYAHPDVLKEKYSFKKNNKRYIGVPWNLDEIDIKSERILLNKEPRYITENIMLSGEIPRVTDFEDIPSTFKVKDNNKYIDDIFNDEQMLIIKEEKGMVIFLGCSHPGVVNCLEYALKLNPDQKIYAVIGGTHLNNTSSLRLEKTIEYLQNADLEKIFPLHCTGLSSMLEIKRTLGDKCILSYVGDIFEL